MLIRGSMGVVLGSNSPILGPVRPFSSWVSIGISSDSFQSLYVIMLVGTYVNQSMNEANNDRGETVVLIMSEEG